MRDPAKRRASKLAASRRESKEKKRIRSARHYKAHREELLAAAKVRRDSHLEEARARWKELYYKNREARLETHRRYRERNGEKYKARVKANAARWYRALRAEVMVAYGNACACCGETRYEFLAIDHVHGGGRQQRKTVRAGSFYKKIREEGFPPKYRLLCHNCNLARGFYGSCPHEAERGPVAVNQTEAQ